MNDFPGRVVQVSFERSAHRIALVFTCIVAMGALLLPAASVEAACGDGLIDCSENCDDGNIVAGDGCNQYCRVEYGFVCPTSTDPLSFAPVGHWRLDELTGTVAADDILANNGTLVGPTLGGTGAVQGQTGSSVAFDGIDDHVLIPHAPQYFTDAGTIAFWYKPAAIPAAGELPTGIFSKDADNYGDGGHVSIYMVGDSGGLLRVRMQVAQNGLRSDKEACTLASECAGGACVSGVCSGAEHAIDIAAPAVGAWHHVALTFGAGGMRLYVNGVLAGTNPYTGGLGLSSGGTGNVEAITLGAHQMNASTGTSTPLRGFFKGGIDDFFFYDYQLSDAEVGAFYDANSCSSPGGACTAGAPVGCGDGVLDPFTEQCDDGNTIAGDGCDALCINEFCSDGLINNATETCDDGGRRDADGCNSDCLVEAGYSCTGTPSVCVPQWVCGNGIVEPGEVCDDPTTCSADCQRLLTCGDGQLDAGEACDDYNLSANDGCSPTCTVENGWTCTVTTHTVRDYPSICNITCGDGILVDATLGGWEQCDDGNVITGDGCDERCQIEKCGDGFIRGTEACDDNNSVGGDGCSATCTIEAGFVCPAENGPCIPETACDPNTLYIRVRPSQYSTTLQECPFDPTRDANADGVLDCADGKHIFAYKAIPAFTITPGVSTLSFDATSTSPTDVIATIEMAVALTEGDYGAQPSGAWTTVATNSTALTRGDGTWYTEDLEFPLDAAFSFPGGGLLIRVTYVQGDVTIRTNYNYTPFQLVSMSTDYDGVYPWDVSVTTNRAPTFVLTDNQAICADNGWMQNWNKDTAGCNPTTLVCYAPRKRFPQTAVWCGGVDMTTSTNCEQNDLWSWSAVSRNVGGSEYCSSYYLYRYNYSSCYSSSGSCGASLTNKETLDNFCENCDEGDPCTSPGFSWSTGCQYYEISPSACWDGDPAKRNIGACSDGLDYCRNPGPECVSANYGSAELCDGVDNDCNSVLDDPVLTDPSCDDGDPFTTDTCTGGMCSHVTNCTQTDTSCGATSPCQDCTLSSGWYYTGNTVACCDTGQSCMCDEYEMRTYYCDTTPTCAYYLEPVSPDYRVSADTCLTCDDGNICTNDSCDIASGLCSNVDSGYTAQCYTGPAGTEGIGQCSGGTESCDINGNLTACTDTTPTTETCDNTDEDCNGFVDDGTADASCPGGQGCWSGTCDIECTDTAQCAANEICYFENSITPGRCAPATGACDDVTCPTGATCYEGSCTNTNCGNDLDCNVYSRCYNSGRCLNTPDERCNGVQCAQGTDCVKGTCAKSCTTNMECDPGSKCYDNYCFPEVDPCAGVDCKVSEICWQGGCFEQCMDSTHCTEPGDVCYDEFRCAPEIDPCFDVTCPVGDICYQGACYLDCSTTPCAEPGEACYNGTRCEVDNCTGVQCPSGEQCQGGVCYLVCTDDAICQANDPSDFCYGGFCKPSACDAVQCAAGEVCQGGVCYTTCGTNEDCTMYDPTHACYGGICTADPCDGFLCPTPEEICYGGACYPYCSGEGTCDDLLDVCYDVDACAVDYVDLCAGVLCPAGEVCSRGSCYYDCSSNEECTMYDPTHACYGGFCGSDACDGVVCPAGDVCSQGTCYQYCDGGTMCDDPTHICYDNTCRPQPLDLCTGVVCAVGEDCYMGVCYEVCSGTVDCSNPDHVCYDSRCVDPCEAASCLAGETCYLGTCYEYCDDTDVCSNPDSVCYENRCVDAEDPWCDGVVCPMAESCYRGTCYATCGDQADCDALPYDSICYKDVCLPTDCSGTTCDMGETCYNGACYEDCSGGLQCSDPDMACYDNRCAASACEAQATTFLADYDSDHVFRRFNHRLYAFQYSTPWMWPRPYESGGDSFTDWAEIGTGAASSSNNDALYSKGAARLVFYFDDNDDRYILYLIQGSKDAAQGAAEANYGIKVKTVDPELIAMDDPGAEGYYETPGAGSWRYVQVNVKTGPSETGGVAIGKFNPGAGGWQIEVSGHFSGDIDRWEMMNGETGEPITTLHMGEPVSIRNVTLVPGETIQPDFGVAQCETDLNGICKPGTALACVNWALTCEPTVYGWGFEICDGLDNTCDGLIDTAAPNLKFAMVQSRQYTTLPWKPWPTVDSNTDIDAYMNYTPRTDDRVGSTNILRDNGNALQQADKVYVAMHRNLVTGQFSMPMVVGARSTDDDDIEDFGDTDYSMSVRSNSGIEEMFVCWYDDRKPGPTEDKIPKTYESTADQMQFEFEIEVEDGALESDSAVLRPVWLEGAAGGLGAVEYGVGVSLDDEDDEDRRWFRHAPKVSDLLLTPHLRFWVRVAAADPEEAYCIADAPTANGCPLGLYTCTPTGIECSPADDAYCEANCGDWDGDGHIVKDPAFCPLGTDCDDFDPESYEGATEYCNGRDNDCDGFIDFQSLTACANGNPECGPLDCGGNFVCSCPSGEREEPGDDEDKCVCGEGLAP